MYIYVCVYIYIYTHTYTYTHIVGSGGRVRRLERVLRVVLGGRPGARMIAIAIIISTVPSLSSLSSLSFFVTIIIIIIIIIIVVVIVVVVVVVVVNYCYLYCYYSYCYHYFHCDYYHYYDYWCRRREMHGAASCRVQLRRHMGCYVLFVTTASTETLNGTILGVIIVCSSPPCPKSYTPNRIV